MTEPVLTERTRPPAPSPARLFQGQLLRPHEHCHCSVTAHGRKILQKLIQRTIALQMFEKGSHRNACAPEHRLAAQNFRVFYNVMVQFHRSICLSKFPLIHSSHKMHLSGSDCKPRKMPIQKMDSLGSRTVTFSSVSPTCRGAFFIWMRFIILKASLISIDS